MKDDILKLRDEIELLHEDLFQFALKRNNIVKKIWALKSKNNIHLTDIQREEKLIHQFDNRAEFVNDEQLKKLYQNIVKSIITENKKILEHQHT